MGGHTGGVMSYGIGIVLHGKSGKQKINVKSRNVNY